MSTAPEPSGPVAPAPPLAPPLAPLPFMVRDRAQDTRDTVTLVLAPVGTDGLPPFRPGQFNMLSVPGRGEVAISISGDPAHGGEWVHTVRSLGLATQALAGAVPGTLVAVRGPYGRGWPVDQARGKDVVVVAGGVGLAPVRPLILELLRHRDRFGRLEVIYGARTPQDLLYASDLAAWRARTDARFQVTVDAAGRDWYGDVGLVTQRIPDARFEGKGTVAYLCGPEIMMRLTAEALEARGIPLDAIWVSLERTMQCGVGLCGHCQLGPYLLCRDGPVLPYRDLAPLMRVRGL
jgi:anaerobic sulfite reductase subunit B